MQPETSIIERAYQLARSGAYATVGEVKSQLRAEGYTNVDGHFTGAALYGALRKLCATSRIGEAAERAEMDAERNRQRKASRSN
jgi:hypothetical protein